MTKPVVQIENWQIVSYGAEGEALWGDAIDHPYVKPGFIQTSKIERKDLDGREVETGNTIYKLVGDPWVPASARVAYD